VLTILIIIFSGLLIITIVVGFIAAKRIVSPVEELHKGSEEIMKGNLNYQVGIKSKDEIGQLSRSFDLMANRLSEYEKELQKHTEKLEEQVKKRTIDLEKQFEKSEKQRIATLSVLTDLNKTTVNLKAEISERKQAEEEKEKLHAQLLQSQKMEAIGTLAGGIAHDFNNILSAVIGYTELSLIKVEKGTSLQTNLQEVLKAGIRAKDLVQQILTFSRQTDHEQGPVQVSLMVKEALKLLRATLPTTIEIQQDIQSNSAVLGNPTQIHQILMNLCTNAGHAMQKDGGILEVSLVNVEVDADFAARHLDMSPGPHLRLTVSDTGYGIEPAIMERMFDPFFTTKEKGEGTGMGLSVVHGIVKDYGGAITVYSEPGSGSTFNVFLPVFEGEVRLETKIEEPLPHGNERILFIDDELAIVDIGRQMLERLGYEVVTRTSSIEALELFRAKPDRFDLVITDMTMPKMTGEEIAREIMLIRPDIPVILCTGFSEKMTAEKAKAKGVKAFLMKPIVMSVTAGTVRQVLDQ
ncbi:MAG: ATP-binding protein, partial [Thermodesulfobacteriota bacterium]|nr:ATP-binding protein [Thermodesulfobacteriota bacterium]